MFYKLEDEIIEISDELLQISDSTVKDIDILGKYQLEVIPESSKIEADFKIVLGNKLKFSDKVLFYPQELLKSGNSFFECILFAIHLSLGIEKKHIILHASAVEIDETLIIFLGNKESGKTTMALSFNKLGYPIVTNDFLELRIENDDVEVLKTDIDKSVSFRLHSAYQMGIQELFSTSTSRNEIYKVSIDKQVHRRIYRNVLFCFPHLVSSEAGLEVYSLNGFDKKVKLFQQLSYYYRNTQVLSVDNNILGSNMIPDEFLISEENHKHIIAILNDILQFNALEFYGEPVDATKYLLEILECKDNESY